jgi:hypothetical protein
MLPLLLFNQIFNFKSNEVLVMTNNLILSLLGLKRMQIFENGTKPLLTQGK